MLETTKYVRKAFHIDAVCVTPENMADVARWVSGRIEQAGNVQYVFVPVHRPINDRQTKAYPGDWVLFSGNGFKVYTPKAFRNSFEQVGVGTTIQALPAPVVVDDPRETPTMLQGVQVPVVPVTQVEEVDSASETVIVEEKQTKAPKPGPRAPRQPSTVVAE